MDARVEGLLDMLIEARAKIWGMEADQAELKREYDQVYSNWEAVSRQVNKAEAERDSLKELLEDSKEESEVKAIAWRPEKKIPVHKGGLAFADSEAETWRGSNYCCCSGLGLHGTAILQCLKEHRSTYAAHIRVAFDFEGTLPDWAEWSHAGNQIEETE